jgi:hypothetical protein
MIEIHSEMMFWAFFILFYRDSILDSAKNVLPPVKTKILTVSESIRKCSKSLQHQLKLLYACSGAVQVVL